MKKTAKLLSVLLCLALAIGMIATVAFAADEKTATISKSDFTETSTYNGVSHDEVRGDITFTFSSSAMRADSIRQYANSTLTISAASGYKITKVDFDDQTDKPFDGNASVTSGGTLSGKTITATGGNVVISTTAQVKYDSITVTYEADGGNGDGDSFDGCTSITYDFASVTETGKEIKDDALDFFNSMADDSHAHLVDASTTKVYQGNGNGNGGTWENSGSIIKMGTGSVEGVLTLTFAEGSDIDSVDIWCHEWPDKNDTVDVNGVKKGAPNSGSIEKLSFELASDTNVVTITTHYRAIISKIVVNGKIEVNTCTHANTEYVVTGAQHQLICSDCSEPQEDKVKHTFTDGACVCGTIIPTAETSIPDANTIGAAKEHNTYTNELYLVSGVITEIVKDDYGNLYIADEAGNKLYVYGTYSADGSTRYDAMDPKPVVGDTITVLGVMGQYNDAPQMKNAWVLDLIPGTTENPEQPETPVAGAVKPVPGTAYKWGLYQATTKKWVFFAGSATEEGGRFMNTTTDFAKATDVYVEEAEGGYHIYFMDGTAKKYLGYHEVENNGKTYNNLGILDEPTVWTWNEEYKTFQTNFGGKDYYVGAYDEFETLGGSETRFISEDGNFAAQFYAQDPAADTGDIAIGAIAALALVSGLGLAVIIKKKEF